MNIIKSTDGNKAVLKLEGWLDTQAAGELEAAIAGVDPSAESLELDLSALEYISSSGIRQFVAAYKKMKGALTLKSVSPEILDVLQMTGIDKRLHIEP